MTKRDLAGIARFALLSFPGAALGAMLPDESIEQIKEMMERRLHTQWIG